ncbi:MAG: hypothetical protein LBL24_04915 [Bacteroidales bacterium]|jgi:hypothetical protein|nr:hypothetical protein [Bacteroidales bacterium]
MKYTRLKNYIYPVLLLFVGVILYLPLLKNQLLDFWDDQWAVMNEYTEGGFHLHNLWRILTEFYHGQYAPLNEYLYLALYEFFGYNPFHFHLASMLLHVANIGLAYATLRKLLILSGRVDRKNVNILSFLTILIFAVHPCNVESVAWMSASKVLVYALFYFGATYTFLLYIEKRKSIYYVWTALLYVLSFLGKDQAVTFPLWMLLVYWFLNFKLTDKPVWKTTIPFFVLSLVFGIVTMLSQSVSGQGVLTDAPAYPLWQRGVYGCYSLMEYLSKSLFPFKLSYLYPFPSAIGDPLPQWLLLYPALLIVIVVCLWKFLSHWALKFGLLFFLIHMAIVLNVVELSRFSIIADRYLYVALMGIGFITAYFLICQKMKPPGKIAVCTLFACYVLYLGIYSGMRIHAWHDTDTLKKEMRDLLKQRDDYKPQEQ